MLVLPNVTTELSKRGEKKNCTTKCDKSIVRGDVGTTQCNNRIVKCEKKNRVPPNVTKVRSRVMLVLSNVTIELSNVTKVLYI